jgi:hypothetical protein
MPPSIQQQLMTAQAMRAIPYSAHDLFRLTGHVKWSFHPDGDKT